MVSNGDAKSIYAPCRQNINGEANRAVNKTRDLYGCVERTFLKSTRDHTDREWTTLANGSFLQRHSSRYFSFVFFVTVTRKHVTST
ncbi:unnamed protein product [Cochlearia groenlandica]